MKKLFPLLTIIFSVFMSAVHAQQLETASFFPYKVATVDELADLVAYDQGPMMDFFRKTIAAKLELAPISRRDLGEYIRDHAKAKPATQTLYTGGALLDPTSPILVGMGRPPVQGEVVFELPMKVKPALTEAQVSAFKGLLTKAAGNKAPKEITALLNGLGQEKEVMMPMVMGNDGMLLLGQL